MLINLPAGSGKSLIGLEVAIQADCKRVLIVCPAFLKLNWRYELKKWYPQKWLHTVVINNSHTADGLKNSERVFAIVGYPFFQKAGNAVFLASQKWDLIICDESHMLRKWGAIRCKEILFYLLKNRERILFLSATPLVSSAADLHPTYSVLQPGKWGKFGQFCNRYCDTVRDHFAPQGFRYVGIHPINGAELKARSKEFVFSAKKSEILSQLPSKRIVDVPLDLGKKFKKFQSIKELLHSIIDGSIEDDEIKTERERIGKEKIKSVLDLLETFPADEPVIIFAWHRSVVEALACEIVKTEKVAFLMGGMPESQRMAAVIDFTEGKINKLVVSIAAGGLGLNLQRASIAVFAELPYSHAEFEQASDRVHRLGSEKPVTIYKLIAVDSIDENINETMEGKRVSAEVAGVATA